MPPSISLEQLSTTLRPKLVRHSFEPLRLHLDCTEYCLGLERGGIYKVASELLITDLQDDMVSLLKDGQWTLLPPPGMLQKIRDLYMRNHDNGTFNRTQFLEAIPENDYEYQFLCLSPPPGRQWRVDGVEYAFPLRDFPPVRTRIHPCFLFPSIMAFIISGPSDESHLTPMRDLVDVCDDINLTRIRSVYVSWLLEGGEFPERITPFARPDRREHLPPPSQPAARSRESTTRRPASTKHVKFTSPPKPTSKQTGTSTKKAILNAPSSKATVSRKPLAKKRKISQSSTTSAKEELPSKRRRSPRFPQT
ncbi:hypothetical protein CPB85DRAFT_1566106 [Mucidula mucida]|nr:hypothetical protein CPB85DRAFT_1566106 [Mucidula mucida]